MFKKRLGMLMPLLIAQGAVVTLLAWGFWGHQQINHHAVFTLPPEMFGFFKQHLAFITEHAVENYFTRGTARIRKHLTLRGVKQTLGCEA